MYKSYLYLLLGVPLLLGWGCREASESTKLAEVDGSVITRSEVDRVAGKQLQELRQEIYRLERQKLDEYIGAMLLTREAKQRNLSVPMLLEQEVNRKISPVSDEDIRNFYDRNKERIRADFEKVHDQIGDYLRDQRTAEAKEAYLKTLRAKAKITTFLRPPPIQRVDVLINGAPSKGSDKAPVKIVKFEDFECPFCKAVQPTLAELVKKYDGKVQLIHKDLPLEAIHPQAQLAAEAARCAGDQGQYWQYHDTLYQNSPKLSPADLKAYAKEVGLDTAAFDQCLESHKHRKGVQQDLAEGAKLGLTGTPSFFINGREISGALPLESFAAIVDEELSGAKSAGR